MECLSFSRSFQIILGLSLFWSLTSWDSYSYKKYFIPVQSYQLSSGSNSKAFSTSDSRLNLVIKLHIAVSTPCGVSRPAYKEFAKRMKSRLPAFDLLNNRR